MSEVVSSSSSSSNAVEANRQNFNIDWRSKKPIFDEQMGYFYMKEEMADVEFVFDRQDKITKVPAHSFALAVASEVFQKELTYGSENEAEKRSKVLQVIEVKDERVEIDALKTALLFIYNAYRKLELTGKSALAVLYIAMKYMIKQLETLCINYLLNNINAENVFTILQFCIDCETDSLLMDTCKEFIRNKTESVLKADSFPEISHRCLTVLLVQDSLNIAEVNLFEAAVQWAKFACEKSGKDPNDGKSIRSQLGAALHLIRFPAMSIKEIAGVVGPTGILSLEEQRDVLYVIGGADPLGPPISIKAILRKRNDYFASMDVLKHESCTLNKLSLLIRIDNFPSFVTSKARHCTRDIIVNNTRWSIILDLRKYCQISAKYIHINAKTSDQPETLGVFVNGKGEKGIDCSFDVVAKFKFKQPHPLDNGNEFTKIVCFNLSNGYGVAVGWGFSHLAEINDLLDPQKGYLVDNALELLVDVTITEAENE